LKPVTLIHSRTVVLPTRDIDTDQIIAARFLTTTSKVGLGKNAFYDLRYNKDGTRNSDFVLNQPEAEGCGILIAGNNFGCGSSREHAPWALLDYGFEAVISTAIADIFSNNSLKNGLVAIAVDEESHQWFLENPGVELSIDVEEMTIKTADGRTTRFLLDGFARHCLLEGIDQLGFLRQQQDAISQFEESRSWKP